MSSSEDTSLTRTGLQGYNPGFSSSLYSHPGRREMLPDGSLGHARHYPSLSSDSGVSEQARAAP